MVASLPVHERNHNRLCSTGNIAHVLPAAQWNQPGVLASASDAETDVASSMPAPSTENITSVVSTPCNAQTQQWQQMFQIIRAFGNRFHVYSDWKFCSRFICSSETDVCTAHGIGDTHTFNSSPSINLYCLQF